MEAKQYMRLLRSELYAAVDECECLGFDDRWAALEAILSHEDFATRWECSQRLIQAVAAYKLALAKVRS